MNKSMLKKSMASFVAVLSFAGLSALATSSVNADQNVTVSSNDYSTMQSAEALLSGKASNVTLDNNGNVTYTKNGLTKTINGSNSNYSMYVNPIISTMNKDGITRVTFNNGVATNQNGEVINVKKVDDTKKNYTKKTNKHSKKSVKKVTIKSLKKDVRSINKQLKNKHLSKNVRKALVAQRADLNKQVKTTASLYKVNDQLKNKKLNKKARKTLVAKRAKLNKALKLDKELTKTNKKLANNKLSHKNRSKDTKHANSLRRQINKLTK